MHGQSSHKVLLESKILSPAHSSITEEGIYTTTGTMVPDVKILLQNVFSCHTNKNDSYIFICTCLEDSIYFVILHKF